MNVFGNFINMVVCFYQHHIAGQQSSIFSKFGMHRFHTPAQGCLIHNVVVYQRKVVKQLNGSGHMKSIGGNGIEQFVTHQT